MSGIYDNPQLYDVLFSDSCAKEIRFIEQCVKMFYGKAAQSVFEPACGSGRLLSRLAKRGYDVAGLDLNPFAIAYCNARLKRHGFAESAFIGDMANFTLADLHRTTAFDISFNFVSSFLHLTDDLQAQNHLLAVAEVLKPAGLYIIGLHLKPVGKAFCSNETWSARRGNLALKSTLTVLARNQVKRIETAEFHINVKTPKKRYQVAETMYLRTYSARQFFKLLDSVKCFRVLGTFSFDYDIKNPVEVDNQTEDVLFVLQR
jgi:SAM-dependent methyltransferase